MFITKMLQSSEITTASALLFREYVEIGNWVFASDNPAGIKIINGDNCKLLIDDIDIDDLIWFGVFDDQVLVGCIRIYRASDNELFEMEKYPAAGKIAANYITPNRPNLYECTRVCVHSDYKAKGVQIILKLYKAALMYVDGESGTIFGAANSDFIKSLFCRIELPCLEENSFKYEETDSTAVNFYLAKSANGELAKIIKNIHRLENSRSISVLDAIEIVAPLLPVPIYWHDCDGRVLGVNTLCLAGMGKPLGEVLGKTPYDLYPKEIADHIWSHSKEVMQNGKTSFQEESIFDDSGERIIALAFKTPIYDEIGKCIGILGTSIDITAEKKAERLRVENEKHEEEKRSRSLLLEFVEQIYSLIQKFEISAFNDALKIKLQGEVKDVQLTRLEKEILYYLSLHKSTRDISGIVSFIEGREFSAEVVEVIIKKVLFGKFNVFSISDLIDKAKLLNVIPFLLTDVNPQ